MTDQSELEAWVRFESLEQKFGLDQWKVSGVYIWKIVRPRVFQLYKEELGFGQIFGQDRLRAIKFIANLPRLLGYMLFANPYFSVSSKSKPLSISSPREKLSGKLLVDTISDRYFLRPHLAKSNVLFTSKGSITHLRNGQKANSIPLLLGRFLAFFHKVTFSEADVRNLSGISEDLIASASIPNAKVAQGNWDSLKVKKLSKQIKSEIAIFKGTKAAYALLFRILKPSRLYVVASYSWAPIIAAAKELSIEVNEFQHGAVFAGHVGYDFRFWREVPYFPDVFLAWGADWFSQVNFPSECQILVIGPNSNQTQLLELRGHEKNEKTLLVLAQGSMTSDLISFVRRFLKIRPDWQALVKPHPREKELRQYTKVFTSHESFDFKIRVHKGDLYSALLKSDVVVGQSSTSIFEAAYSGRKAVIVRGRFRVPVDIAQMCDLRVVDTPEELAREIDTLGSSNTHGLFSEKNLNLDSFR